MALLRNGRAAGVCTVKARKAVMGVAAGPEPPRGPPRIASSLSMA